jgi:membrane fusion protein, copper/silver efflux system
MNTTGKLAAITAFTFLALTILGVSGCSKPAQQQSGTQTKQYTCSMHPNVVQDKPGKCPKCGMDLVEKH